jgi:multidrug efflux system membrane fusion protein
MSFSALFVHAAGIEGVLSWENKVMLGFPVTGVVQQVLVHPGMKIAKGQALASLDQRSFQINLKRQNAKKDRLTPLLNNAKRELEQATELYDRTVLSEVELQIIAGKYDSLQADYKIAIADIELAQLHLEYARLVSPVNGLLIANHFVQGMIISEENKADMFMELAYTSVMQVELSVNREQMSTLSIQQTVNIYIDSEKVQGEVKSIHRKPDADGLYKIVVRFPNDSEKRYAAGQAVKVIF